MCGSVLVSLFLVFLVGLFYGEKWVGEVCLVVLIEGGWIGLVMVLLLGLDVEMVLSLMVGGLVDVWWEVVKL